MIMKKLCLFIWAVLLLHACQTPPAKNTAINLKDTVNYAYQIKQSNQWLINNNRHNVFIVMNVLKAYEHGDTASLNKYLADSITIYYDGGIYKGARHEFMYAIKERVKFLKGLKIKLKDWESVISRDRQQERVNTWYTLYYKTTEGKADSVDVLDEARLKDGKITVWYDYSRKYRKND